MTFSEEKLSPAERKLLDAVISAVRNGSCDGTFVIRREGYGFTVELDGFSHPLTDAEEKSEFELGLKNLVAHGLIKRTDTHGANAPQWQYALAGPALEMAKEK